MDYPSSLGFLWERVSEFLGFDRYDGPGKVMALGTSLDSRSLLSGVPYLDRFRQFVRPTADGGFFIEPDVLRYRARDFDGLEKVLGPRCGILNEPREVAAVAAGLQLITEEILCFITEHLFRSLNSKNPSPHTSDLCMAGGVALNCVANARILERTSWNRIWVQPAANDAGTALGAALAIWNLDLGHSERVALGNVFQGPEFSDRQYEAALVKAGFSYRRPRNQSRGIAEKLAQGAAIGLFQGRMEFGPRALGNRSILADPRRRETRQILNRKVKERESFRPFAPSILADRVAEMFEFPASIDRSIGNPADFMLLTVPVKAGCEERIPSAIHTNLSTNASSARVHLVAAQPSTGSLRAILEEFDSLTGCPALLNTSMNVSEPIVCTPDHACATFLRSGLDILSLGYYLVERAQ